MTKANTTKQRKTEVRNPDKQTQTKQTPKYLTGGKWLPVAVHVDAGFELRTAELLQEPCLAHLSRTMQDKRLPVGGLLPVE